MQSMFLCPRISGNLMLSPASCAQLWNKGQKAKPWDAAIKCQGCSIGAKHAGKKVPRKREPRIQYGLCPRCLDPCGRIAIKDSGICVSCFNREREIQLGRNARGKPPQPISVMLSLDIPTTHTVSVSHVSVYADGNLRVLKAARPVEAMIRLFRKGHLMLGRTIPKDIL